MAEYSIRETIETDLPQVTELAKRFFAEEAPNDPDLNLDFSETEKGQTYFRSFFEEDNKVRYVVESEGKIVGYASGEFMDQQIYLSPHCFFHELYLEPVFRRRGIGTELYEKLADWGKQRGAKRMHLNVYHLNTSAQAFYQKLGFNPRHHQLGRSLDE